MIPVDFTPLDLLAILFIFTSWFAYPWILKLIGIAPLNSQLGVARRRWVEQIATRAGNPFDAILLGHVVHSVAFFGSATLIVLAGIFSIFVKLEDIHTTLTSFELVRNSSTELFIFTYSILAVVLTICFFSFTYTLRKLLYSLALIGALPDQPESDEQLKEMVNETTIVITESLKTFNFGIRGYYYAIACISLFVSPVACIVTTLIITIVLIFRQLKTPTSKAIQGFIKQI